MKSVSILALAAGAAATGFRGANPFTCPGNTDNHCTDTQKPGYDFGDLPFGGFQSYKDFNWFGGWSCNSGSGSGKRFAPRTNQKVIGATCHSEKSKSPSFGCGPSLDKFSLGGLFVSVEFDCDLEFHYDMPDGSTCKHRNSCSKSGTNIVNSQCGGAKNVTIVYPPQSNKPKPSCGINIHTMTFDCNTGKTTSTKPATTAPTSTKKTIVATTTTSSTLGKTTVTSSATSSSPAKDTSAKDSTTAKATTTSSPAKDTTVSSSPAKDTSSSVPAKDTSTAILPGTTGPFGNSSTSTTGKVSPVQSTTSATVAPVSSTTDVVIVTSSINTFTTEFVTTSTIFTTSTQTITSCAAAVTNCPARSQSVVTTVVTIAVSTTICPVTETRTEVVTGTTTSAVVVTTAASTAAVSTGAVTTPAVTSPEVTGTSTVAAVSSATTSEKPTETLPCPDVVPKCLNTFMFSVSCSDNTDSSCYCPNEIFIKSVFDCVYAHGETDEIVSESVLYLQGLCAPHVGENPAIATGATITSYVTPTVTVTPSAVYTTVTVDATTVVPCTDSAGSVIVSSSSTVTVQATLTVPQVGFQTSEGSVGVIPVTTYPAAQTTPANVAVTTIGRATSVPAGAATGTGSFRATPTVVVAGANGRASAGFGLALGIMGVLAAL